MITALIVGIVSFGVGTVYGPSALASVKASAGRCPVLNKFIGPKA